MYSCILVVPREHAEWPDNTLQGFLLLLLLKGFWELGV